MPTRSDEKKAPGRPSVNPMLKASIAWRFLISPLVEMTLTKVMRLHGFSPNNKGDVSAFVRWCVYQQIKRDGMAGELNLEEDNTWAELRDRGLL